MTRVVKEASERRQEILDVAQRLFYLKGYEQTSVKDIIDPIGIAKGTFYHHFASKQDLLDALVDRIAAQTAQVLEPIAQDDQLNAIDKFNRFFAAAGAFKLANKDALQAIWQTWYGDDNALLRERTQAKSVQEFSPLLAQVIGQGVTEGYFTVDQPQAVAKIVLQIGQTMTLSLADLFLEDDPSDFGTIEKTAAAYDEAIRRILGAPADSIKIAPIDIFHHWFAR